MMQTTRAPARRVPLASQQRSKLGEKVFVWTCRVAIFLPLALLLYLLLDVALDGIGRLDWDFLQGTPSRRAARAGIKPALVGSLYLIGLTALLSLPLGVGAAIYLEEYGRRSRLAGIIEVAIANLAGVPSVIYGLLGLGLFVRAFGLGPSVLAVIMSSREALRTVPDSLREAALGLGATRWQMIQRVILPMCLPGILTGAILAISRAIGETAPLIIVGAVVFISFLPDGLDSQFTALPIQIFNWVSMPKREFLINAAAGIVVLMGTLLVLNSIAILLRNRYQTRNQ